MRALILIACSALILSACHGNQAAGNTANVDETLTSDSIGSNDATAIDAATNDAANMAADVNFTLNEADMNNVGDGNLSNDSAANAM